MPVYVCLWLDTSSYMSSVHYIQTCVVFIMCRELRSVPALPGPVLRTDTQAN